MSTALTGNFSAECPGIIKTMHRFTRYRIALRQRFGADTEETGRYDLVERFGSVPNASVTVFELSKV